ncbi:hypothetical protein P154DRAFT_502228, partial [Amniculicola lignicola CBS 123094]
MERDGGRRNFASFNDAMGAPGDTQPDSQLYREFTSGIYGSGGGSGSHDAAAHHPLLDPRDDHGGASGTDHTDGADPVDSSQEQHTAITSPTVIHDDEPDTDMQLPDDRPLTSPLKFTTPMIGRKRDSQGQVLSSAMRTATTPGTGLTLTAFNFGSAIGGGGGGITLTQAFNATQAGTSPLVGAPSEDAVFQRPSPNFVNARPSSPLQAALSSPIKAPRTDPHLRSSSEPRSEYVTMKQSQEQRARGLPRNETADSAQDSWGEPTAAEKSYAARKAREQFNERAGKSLANIAAPPRQPERRVKRRGLLSTSTTPKFRRPDRHAVFAGGDSDGLDSPGVASSPVGLDSDDSLDELSQGIPSGVRSSHMKPAVQVPKTSSHPTRTLSGQSVPHLSPRPRGSPSSQHQRQAQFQPGSQSLLRSPSRLRSTRESVTIMDSQPDAVFDSNPPPRPIVFPSSPSTNQYSISQTTMLKKTGFTSQFISSSIPPPPPRSSSPASVSASDDEATEDRVPSSPPAVEQNEEITYDEHCGDIAEELEVVRSTNGDINMEDDHDGSAIEGSEVEDEEMEPYVDEMELGSPRQVSVGPERDDQVPEPAEETLLDETHEDDMIHSSHPEDSPAQEHSRPTRLERQATVPESDMLEDTQPSLFAPSGATSHNDAAHDESAVSEREMHNTDNTNSTRTEPFQTARENLSPINDNSGRSNTNSSSANAKNTNQARRIRSLQEIANQPETKLSQNLSDIEIPQLSFHTDFDEDLGAMPRSSPARLAAKKRKITYSAKKSKKFGGFVQNSDSASELGNSPLKQVTQRENDSSLSPVSSSAQSAPAAETAAVNDDSREDLIPAPTRRSAAPRRMLQRQKQSKPGALKPVNKALLKNPSPLSKSVKAMPVTAKARKVTAVPTDVETPDVDVYDDFDGDDDELAVSTPTSAPKPTRKRAPKPAKSTATMRVVTTPVISKPQDMVMTDDGDLLVPNRIFAYWPSGGMLFYPATCMSPTDSSRAEVRYDDGNIHPLEIHSIRALDLHIGDHVKIDEVGMKKHMYTIIGFKDKIEHVREGDFPLTDRRGFQTLVLERKQRDSLPGQVEEEKEVIEMPVTKVYLTQQMYAKYSDRQFTFTRPGSSPLAAQMPSPSDIPNGSAPMTPTASRRGTTAPKLLKEVATRAGSVASSIQTGNAFAGMAFTTTSKMMEETERANLVTLIKANAGIVLEGFHELFEDTNQPSAETTPPNDTNKKDNPTPPSSNPLVIKPEYKDLKFVALISDAHTRSPKFLQALALNIPCLHARWLTDSLSSSRALPFAKYLLPAGESKFLNPA